MSEKQDILSPEPITELDGLIDKVSNLIGNPINVWAVAATIESLGVREVDAQQDFGFDSVFDLAEVVHSRLKEKVEEEGPYLDQEELANHKIEKPPYKKRLGLFIKYYSQGLLFSLPMISQIAAILIFRYSLWAWLEFNEAQATLVAFGTIAAFVITGGFTQALGRSVSKYMSENNYYLAFNATKNIIKSGVITTLGSILFIYLLNLVIPFYPQGMLVLGLSYLGLISLLLLFSGVLYALEQRLMILAIILVGTGIVIFGMDVLNIGIYMSQWIGMGATIIMLVGYGYLYFKLKIKSSRQDLIKQSLPTAEVRYFINYRYFVYGLCYFLFLFLDRIMAWTAGPPPPPYIMWFNTPYELGMDWALLSLVPTIAVLEYSVQAFSGQLMRIQKKTIFLKYDQFNNYFKWFYFRQLFLLLIFGALSITLTYFSVDALKVWATEVPEIRDFFANPMTTQVFWAASISYFFVVVGLLHSLFFFTLNKPAFAMYSIIGALGVNFFVGYICSRIFSLEYAVIGLLAGAITFAVISGLIAKSFFKRLDYYYYSAF